MRSATQSIARPLSITCVAVSPRPRWACCSPASWAFEPGVFQFTHDPAERAIALLRTPATRPDGDGPEPRLRLSLKVSTNGFIRLQAAVIQQDLKRVGIDLDVRS